MSKKLQKTVKELRLLVREYNRNEYCECGCHGSGYPGSPHGLIGQNRFEQRVTDPKFVKELGAILNYLKKRWNNKR